jgi:serine-type D-Ala-D-Ala carboxypeptidase (penicillin-binding protein 5/6)
MFDILTDIDKRTKAFPKLIIALCIVTILAYGLLIQRGTPGKAEAKREPRQFDTVALTAKAAVVLDVNSGKLLYAKNPDLPLPLASLTKIMTAITAEKIAKGMDRISINEDALTAEGDSGLKVASAWKTRNLIDYFLVVSSNDGARALAGAAAAWSKQDFVSEMNRTGKEIGLSNSTFFNEHGLDRGREEMRAGAYGSAQDMAKLFQYALKNYPEVLEATRYPELLIKDENNDSYIATNTNLAVNSIPSLIASKTGYTDLAGGNLIIAFDAGLEQPVIIVVLGSTQEGRFEDIMKLVNETVRYVSQD